jgi:hypothetical protein
MRFLLSASASSCPSLVFSTSFSGAVNLVDLIAMQIDTQRLPRVIQNSYFKVVTESRCRLNA